MALLGTGRFLGSGFELFWACHILGGVGRYLVLQALDN